MKRIQTYIVMLVLLLLPSCGGEDLLVINYVHTDGSVSRKIIMTWDQEEFDLEDSKVPVDSTWIISTTRETYTQSEPEDTIYTLTAEKTFKSVDEINDDYATYGGANGGMTRWTEFSKRFRWFNTIFYFSENIKKAIEGYPPEDFFSSDELHLFYMPKKIQNDYLDGPDSLLYQARLDSLDEKSELWLGRSLVKAAIMELDSIVNSDPDNLIDMKNVWAKEQALGEIILSFDTEEAIDSLFGPGFYTLNQESIDSALARLETKFLPAFDAESYMVQTQMPGELLVTNGYIDTDGNIIWEVDGDFILSKDYSMWAQARVTNWWAWIVSTLFILFIITGFILRISKNRKT